jgi:hypothetical protein
MWTHKNTFAIGGLENVGFDNHDYLTVLSSQGIGIFDCLRGEKIFRDAGHEWWNDFNEANSTITGYGILSGCVIQTGGMYGEDCLNKTTADGWQLELTTPSPAPPPFEKYMVQKIYLTHKESGHRELIGQDSPCELRAYGFSDTGNTLIIALSCDLIIWTRS